MIDKARVTYVFGNGDLVRLTGTRDWDDEGDHEGVWPADAPEASIYLDNAGWADVHPLQAMQFLEPGDVVTIIVERVNPDAAAPAPGVEWCLFADGPDPDSCVFADGFGDDEAAARDALRYLKAKGDKGIAHRSMLPGAWVVERAE
jgi:hypothetical protein